MSIRIEVKSAACTDRNVTIKNGPRAGQVASFKEQVAYASLMDRDGTAKPYPTEVRLTVDQPYPVGMYTLSPTSFYPDKFGGLTMGRVKLTLLK